MLVRTYSSYVKSDFSGNPSRTPSFYEECMYEPRAKAEHFSFNVVLFFMQLAKNNTLFCFSTNFDLV